MGRFWVGGLVLMCLASTPGRAAAIAAALPSTIPSVLGGATPAAVDELFETAAASLVPIFTDPAEAEPTLPPTAVYDISAHVVVMPDGARLEAHSGLGERVDDPRSVRRHMRGATPPALYDLTRRKGLFHGVMALRMIPREGEVFGRTGLLTHTYMLHGRPESNGCVVFRDYGAFLNAFREGRLKRLRVVPSVGDAALRGA